MTDTPESFASPEDYKAAEDAARDALAGGTLTGTATQSAHPGRATFRTFISQAVPAVVGLLVLLPLLAPVLLSWAQESAEVVPAEVTAWVAGFAAYVAAASSLITRALAVPGVETWLRQHIPWLAAAPEVESAKHRAV